MLVTVTNPLDNTDIEVELSLNVAVTVQGNRKFLSVSASGSKVLTDAMPETPLNEVE